MDGDVIPGVLLERKLLLAFWNKLLLLYVVGLLIPLFSFENMKEDLLLLVRNRLLLLLVGVLLALIIPTDDLNWLLFCELSKLFVAFLPVLLLQDKLLALLP